jgi:mannose-6-phosphate isomerase-like protein (cupin superfamily)
VSYPATRYEGDGGEISARIRRADAAPELVRANGSPVHYLATGGSTDGLFGLYRWELGVDRGGADAHFHRSFSESFFVLTGTVSFFDGSRWLDTGVGDFVHVPPGGIHGFRNDSGEPASMLLLFTPGAPREAYFEGLADVAGMAPHERDEFFRQHDNLWLDG